VWDRIASHQSEYKEYSALRRDDGGLNRHLTTFRSGWPSEHTEPEEQTLPTCSEKPTVDRCPATAGVGDVKRTLRIAAACVAVGGKRAYTSRLGKGRSARESSHSIGVRNTLYGPEQKFRRACRPAALDAIEALNLGVRRERYSTRTRIARRATLLELGCHLQSFGASSLRPRFALMRSRAGPPRRMRGGAQEITKQGLEYSAAAVV
jgi:hypothetical protein